MRDKILLSLIIFLIIILAVCMYKQGHWWGDDFALYINQARAISNNSINALVETNKFAIDNSSMQGFSPAIYPWGFPILISPIVYFAGINIESLKFLIVFFFLAFIFIYYVAYKATVSDYILPALLLLGTNVHFLGMLNNIQTEIPYLFFVVFSLWRMNIFCKNPRIAAGIGLGFVLWFTFQIRAEGFILLIALFAGQLSIFVRDKIYRQKDILKHWAIASFMPYIGFLSSLILASFVFPSGFLDYAQYLDLPNLPEIKRVIGLYSSRFSLVLTGTYAPLMQLIVIIFFLLGIIYRFKKDISGAVYTILILTLFIIWPFREFRYTMLLFPFVFYFILQGIIITSEKFIPYLSFRKFFVFSLLFFCIIKNSFLLFNNINHKEDHYADGPETANSREMFSFIKENTASTDTVLFFRPRAMALYTDRKSAMIFDDWLNIIRKGTYYVFDKKPNTICQFDTHHPFYLSAQFNMYFSKEFENAEFIVYLIRK